MTRGGRRRAAKAMTCLSCRALLDSCRSFCDKECEKYARKHGYAGCGAAKTPRGIKIDRAKSNAYRRRGE